MRLPSLLLLFSVILSAQTAVFEGTATHSITKQPLEGVHVRLMGFSFDGPGEAYGAMSDRAGHFSITLKPGTYVLMPRFRGFVLTHKNEGSIAVPSVTLKPGEHVSDFQLELTPHAVIRGRVVDEFGDPLQNVSVQLESASPDTPVVSPNLDNPGISQTDDRGQFRVVTGPGKYYVKVTPPMSNRSEMPEIRTDGSTLPDYGVTWYPGVAAKEQAAAAEVEAGGEVSLEIHITRAAMHRTVSLSGFVRGIPEGTGYATVQLQPTDQQNFSGWQTTQVHPDGRFSFPRVEPGTYRLFATSSGTQGRGSSLEVKLDGDVSNVEVNLTGVAELAGMLEFVGTPPPTEKRTVRLEADTWFDMGTAPSAEINRDGTFHIAGVGGGRLKVRLDPLPDNAYISALTLDGTAVASDVVEFPQGSRSSKLKITVRLDGAQISGVLLDRDGNQLSSSLGVVMLIDDPAHVNVYFNFNDKKSARVGGDGHYSFQGVRPGKYRLLALDAFHTPGLDKPEAMKKLAEAAEEFEIAAGARLVKNVKVAGQEDADGKAKQ